MKKFMMSSGLVLLLFLGACANKEELIVFGEWVVEKEGVFQVQGLEWGDGGEVVKQAFPDETFSTQAGEAIGGGELVGEAHPWKGAEYRMIFTFQDMECKDLGSARLSIACGSEEIYKEVLETLHKEADAYMPQPMTDGGLDAILEEDNAVTWEGDDGSYVYLQKSKGQNIIGIQVTMPRKE